MASGTKCRNVNLISLITYIVSLVDHPTCKQEAVGLSPILGTLLLLLLLDYSQSCEQK